MVTVKRITSYRAGLKSMKLKNDTLSRGMYLPEQQDAWLMHFVSIQISLFLNVQFTFIRCLSLLCVFCETISMFQQRKCFFQQIVRIYIQHKQYRGKVSNHQILFNFTFHVKATYNYRKLISSSPHHACLQSPVKNAYMLLIQYLGPFIMLQRDYWDHCLSEAI